MKTILFIMGFSFVGTVFLCAQQTEEAVFNDHPLTWKVAFVRIAWEFDKGTDMAEVKKFNDAIDRTLAMADGYSGYLDAGGEGSPPVPRNPFIKLGLLKLQAAQGLLDHRYLHMSEEQRGTFYICGKVISALPKTIRFSRLQMSLQVTVYNTTAADITLVGSGELPIFCRGKPVVTVKPKEPLNGLTVSPGLTNGVDLVFLADLDVGQSASMMAAVGDGLNVDLVRAQLKALQNNKDLRLAMDVNNRRTYKFAVSYGEDDLIAWRVKKRAGTDGTELTVSDIIEKINAKGVRDDQGNPLLKIKDNRCVGIGTLPVIGKEYLLIADHGTGKAFFLWDWPLDTVIQGDVVLRLASQKTHAYGSEVSPEVVQGVTRYEAFNHNPFAQLILGKCHEFQIGVQKDPKVAVQWYIQAAGQGNGFGMYCLSGCYLKGVGVENDEKAAMTWLRRAAEQGDADAQYHLGYCYEMGLHIEVNVQEAVKWYRKGAEQGELCSQHRLGRCYARAIGVEKDERAAIEWYRKAADQGHGEAENCLGYCILKGIGIEKDEKEALKWFRKSAIRGFYEGLFMVGRSYAKGYGIEKDDRAAVVWYLKAAKAGHTMGQNNLGACYLNGLGVEKDEREAVKWFRLSAEAGNATGQNSLGYCYRNGLGVEKNGKEAVKWLRLAVENGNDVANKTLGRCYLEGLGVEKDEAEGVRLLRKAVEMGVESAKDELKKIGK